MPTRLQLAFPGRSTDFCVDGARASEARRALLRDVADRDVLLFPDPAGGYRYEVVEGEPL